MPRVVHAVVFDVVGEAVSRHIRRNDPLGNQLDPADPRNTHARTCRHGRGTVNGKAFHAEAIQDHAASPWQWNVRVWGVGLSRQDEDAVRKRLPDAPADLTIDLRHLGDLDHEAEAEALAPVFAGRTIWLGVPDRALNRHATAQGAQWNDGPKCWSVIEGADMVELACHGITQRPEPRWRRLDGDTRGCREELRALPVRWVSNLGPVTPDGGDSGAWFVDVAVADRAALRDVCARCDLAVSESFELSLARACSRWTHQPFTEPDGDQSWDWDGEPPAMAASTRRL